jgi:ribose transport system permease protein
MTDKFVEPGANPTLWERALAYYKNGNVKMQEIAMPVVILMLFVAGTASSDAFLTESNLLNVLVQASVAGVVAIGMTFVIATGGIDLSVGSILAVSAVAGGQFADDGAIPFIVVTILFACLCGMVNGLAISWLKIVPFITTLATMSIGRGLALNISDKTPVGLYELDLVTRIGAGKVGPIPIPAIVFIAVTVGGWFLLNRTRYGRYVVAVGGNREAARIAGIRVRQIIFSVYALTGFCVGIASVLLAGRLASASPIAGNGLELDAIAAVVIGGTALAGGRASIVGTFLGVITFALVFNLLNLLNMPSEIQQIVKGAIILAAVAVQRRDH